MFTVCLIRGVSSYYSVHCKTLCTSDNKSGDLYFHAKKTRKRYLCLHDTLVRVTDNDDQILSLIRITTANKITSLNTFKYFTNYVMKKSVLKVLCHVVHSDTHDYAQFAPVQLFLIIFFLVILKLTWIYLIFRSVKIYFINSHN